MNKRDSQLALNFTPPSSLIDAISEIQNYYLVEDSGQPMKKEFFTMTHTMGFSKVGISSAFMDSIVWLIGYVFIGSIVYYVQQNYLVERTTQILFWQVNGSPFYWFTKLASFGMLMFSTVLCLMMSRYYTGTVPKKAIHTLFATRAMFLISFSFVSFMVLGVLYKYAMNEVVLQKIYVFLCRFNQSFAADMYLFLKTYFRRLLFEAGITALIASVVSVIVPFLGIAYFRVTRHRNSDLGISTK